MNAKFKTALAMAAVAISAQAVAGPTFYEREDFQGRSFTTEQQVRNFERMGFNDRASSVVVTGERWEVCEDVRFRGRCVVLRPGRYSSLAAMGLNDRISSVRGVSRSAKIDSSRYAPDPNVAAAQVVFYERDGFQGRTFTTEKPVGNFERVGFNDRASSVVVSGERWEVCEDARFSGRCVVLRPGRYPSLTAIGLNNSISSVRDIGRNEQVDNNRYAPDPNVAAGPAPQVAFYEGEGFQGRSFATEQQVGNFDRIGFNDRASSAVVSGERWEVCEDTRFSGRCVVLRPGRYPSLAAMGLNNRISSVRDVSKSEQIDNNRYAPDPNVAAGPTPQVAFYEGEGFQGRSFTTEQQVGNFERVGFNDRASSAVVSGERWEVCEDTRFSGRCVVLRPGRYPSLAAMGLNNRISSVRDVSKNDQIDNNRYAPDPNAAVGGNAQVVFYEREGFQGRSFTTEQQVGNFERVGFNDRASSAVVFGDRWEVCEDTRFSGRCVVLRPGRYPSLAAMGLNNRISSVRDVSKNDQIDNHRYAPTSDSVYDNRRRNDERLYQANVTSVRAVAGTPGQRCWVEQEQVPQQSSINLPGALIGAAIGGVLGHQVGSGRGNDIATVGGVVIGGAVGANVGRGQQAAATRDVQRCENVPSQFRPDYWDVTYNFRGQEHRMQMTTAPGATVTVNERGEPRS